MFKKVLVLADGTDPAQPALRRALSCVTDDGEIEIFAVVYEPMLEGYLGNKAIYEPLRQRVVAERRERAAELARAVEAEGVRGVANAVWSHPMHAAVGTEVEANGIDLVVAAPANLHQGGAASRGRGLTHSDWQVVTSCPAPLLLVNGDGRAKYRHIVVAIDPFHAHAKPAELDRDLLREAKALQVLTGARLSVLHCYAPVDYFGADLTLVPARDPRFVDARVEAVRALCSEAGIDPGAAQLVVGTPHDVLRTLQQRGEADVIVMGALARGRVAEFIVGNTAERVLHDASADVLLVAPRGSATNR